MTTTEKKHMPTVRRLLGLVLAGAAFAAAGLVAWQASMLTLATVTSTTLQYTAGGTEKSSVAQVELPGGDTGVLTGGGAYPVGAEVAVTPGMGGWIPSEGLIAHAASTAEALPWVMVASLCAAGLVALVLALRPALLRGDGADGAQD